MIFVALEITALFLYILAAIDKTNTVITRGTEIFPDRWPFCGLCPLWIQSYLESQAP